MISDHRRKRAFEIAGIEKISARDKELTRGEVILSMVDSTLQRDEILPSKKAYVFKMRLEAMNRQGMRTDRTSTPVKLKFRTNELLADEVGESREQIRRYIRLTNLISELLDLVDEKLIAMRPAVEISYFTPEAQMWLYDAIGTSDAPLLMHKLCE